MASQVVIENPILNSPFREPTRHFKFDDDGITDEIIESRRISSYFIPIPRTRKKGASQASLYDDWNQNRQEETKLVNDIRRQVSIWRKGNYAGITEVTRRLLEYWTNPERERKLFFCQIEALETAIYITEVAQKYGDGWILETLRTANEGANPGLPRIAFKMATGSGKTVVMAMLIAWQTLNRRANSKDTRFTDAFLFVAPGITIRDRLRVLYPSDPDNYYRQRDIVPNYQLEELQSAQIVITNFHAFQQREGGGPNAVGKAVLGITGESPFKETPEQMARRVCKTFGSKKNIIVINDEAHHCYRRKPEDAEEVALKGDDRKEAEKRDEEARIWLNGLEAVKQKIGIKAIYDLSATPFFLRGSGYSEGTLFPWVVSDFSLVDAIESGIVKIPRVPVSDNTGDGELPTYRDLWLRIRDELPKKGRGTEKLSEEPKLPLELEGALNALYSNYEKSFTLWLQQNADHPDATPPVFIVVCNNTNVSRLVYNYIAGWERKLSEEVSRVQEGKLPLLRNDDGTGGWLSRPNTILVDSEQLDSGEAMSADFKAASAQEIEEFKRELRIRFPGRDVEDLPDEELLREVMNTVGKPGKLGEHVRCVVSVSMLTEGWDANTVTHILGVRAFGTQLLSEQVVGRALRRVDYTPDENGMFAAEYAEVFGVPFSFIPTAGARAEPKPPKPHTRVRALEDRIDLEITYPRLAGYRYNLPSETLRAEFSDSSKLALSTREIPTRVETAGVVGLTEIISLENLRDVRPNTVAFILAEQIMRKYLRDPEGNDRPWLFPQLLRVVKEWMAECVTCKDDIFIQMLLLGEVAQDATDKIYNSIVQSTQGAKVLLPVMRSYDQTGSTRYVDFDTTRPVFTTHWQKSHVSHVPLDSEWERVLAERVENMDEVLSYVKNLQLGFSIPYTLNGETRQYLPDYILRIDDGNGAEDPLNLIVEVTGEKKKDKVAKVETARIYWVPAVNNHGGFGRWDFIEITDPWDAANTIRARAAVTTSETSDGI